MKTETQQTFELGEDSLNPSVRDLRPSATVAINELADRLRKAGRDIIKLGLGQSPFPVPDCVVASLQQNAFQKDYLPVTGLPALRESIAAHNRRNYGIECQAEDVLIGPGSKELMFLLQVAFDGQLIIPSPSWVSYEPQARIVGRDVFWIDTSATDRWQLTAQTLQMFCELNRSDRPRILVLNYPSNPTGQTLTQGQLAEIAAVARQNRVLILSDEIYGKVHHEGRHQSLVSLYPEGTIYSTGLSKWCGAGGWRLGLFVFPPSMKRLREAMAAIASETYTSTSAPIQHAAITAFDGGPEIDDYLLHSRRVLKAIGDWLGHRLRDIGGSVFDAEGGFYLFPDFEQHRDALAARGIETSQALCEQILAETGVAMLPGSSFGRPAGELTLRLAFVDFDGTEALQGSRGTQNMDHLGIEFLQSYCPRIVAAMERLEAFFAPQG